MAIARNEEELEEIGAEDQATKIKTEFRYFRDTRRLLRRINNDFEQEYIASGNVINADSYKEELAALLLLDYLNTSKNFKFTIRESFVEKVTPEINATINRDINNRLKNLSIRESDLILNTTNKEISKQLSNTVSTFIEENKELVRVDIAKETKKGLNARVNGRANNIAVSENQLAAEQTKTIEELVLKENNVVLDETPIIDLDAFWITFGDERVRPAHAAAQKQKRNIDRLFFVGGEFLRQPRDPNGRPDNIIRCRCSVVYGLERDF